MTITSFRTVLSECVKSWGFSNDLFGVVERLLAKFFSELVVFAAGNVTG